MDEKRAIEERICKYGVQYLVAENSMPVKVKFHYYGEKIFRQKTYLRPNPIGKPVDGVYTFACTERQAANYFFSFGRNVEILEPEKLRQNFALGYRQAAEMYDE